MSGARKTGAVLALGFLLVLALGAALAPWLCRQDPLEIDLDLSRQAPGARHWFGTDNEGRDVFARVLTGARTALGVGLGATALATALGLGVGAAAGFRAGGAVDKILCALTDIALAFPSLLLAIAISVVMPPGPGAVFAALALSGWGDFARLTRGLVISLRENSYVTASRAIGVAETALLLRHVVPGCLPSLCVAAGLKAGTFILAEAGLSFLGIGVPPPAPTWGGMVNLGREYLIEAPWMSFFPGLMIALTVLSLNLAGDFLRQHLTPERKAAAGAA